MSTFNPFSSSSSSSVSSPSTSTPVSTSSSSSFSSLNNIFNKDTNSLPDTSALSNPVVIGTVVLLLAFVGFNVFEYFAKGLDAVSDILKPVFKFFISLFAQIFNVAAEGTKDVVDASTTSAQKVVASAVNAGSSSTPSSNLNQTLNNANGKVLNPPDEDGVQADDTLSTIQTGSGKSGWCYIGEERGYRSCASVETSDKCMSGDIFPSEEVCVNPSLRA